MWGEGGSGGRGGRGAWGHIDDDKRRDWLEPISRERAERSRRLKSERASAIKEGEEARRNCEK